MGISTDLTGFLETCQVCFYIVFFFVITVKSPPKNNAAMPMAIMLNLSIGLSRAMKGVDSGVGVFMARIIVGVDNGWGDIATIGVMDASRGAGCVAPFNISKC